MGLLSKLKSGVIKTLDTLSGIVTNPVTAVTQGVKASTAAYTSATTSQNVLKTVYNTGAAAAVVAGGAVVASGGGAALASKLIPTSTVGKVTAGLVAPVAASYALAKPTQTLKTVAETPTNLANFGANVGNFAANPTLQGGGKIFKENPYLAGGTSAAVALLGAKLAGGVANAVSNYQNTEALQENTQKSKMNSNIETPEWALSYAQQKNLIQLQGDEARKTIETEAKFRALPYVAPAVEALPHTEASAPVGATAPKKKKKRKAKKKPKKKAKSKKKTRRSKKKSKKKKKKTIKRRKN